MREAWEQGDTTFSCFPVVYEKQYDYQPQWEPMSYKILKKLKNAIRLYGANSLYTFQIVEILANNWMTAYDWIQMAYAYLSGGQFLLWKAKYQEQIEQQVVINEKEGKQRTYPMLIGESPRQQFPLVRAALKLTLECKRQAP